MGRARQTSARSEPLETFRCWAVSKATLTNAINSAPYHKDVFVEQKVFLEEPVDTTKILIEEIDATLSLVRATPRGGLGDIHPRSTRKLIELVAPHLRTHDTLLSDSFQDRRGFGTSDLADVTKERDRMLAEFRRRLELTSYFHRCGALNGLILDCTGDTLVDLFAAFGVSQNIVDFDLGNTAINTVTKIMAAKRAAEAELDVPVTKWIAFASPGFLDLLREHGSTGYSRAGWEAAADLKDGASVFNHGGVEWHELGPVAGIQMIASGAAFLVPKVKGLLRTPFAPADYMDTVNSAGLPLYARAEPLPMNRGVKIEAQTNPVSYCTKPRALIRCEA